MKRLECKACPLHSRDVVVRETDNEGNSHTRTKTLMVHPRFRSPRQLARHLQKKHSNNKGLQEAAEKLLTLAKLRVKEARRGRR